MVALNRNGVKNKLLSLMIAVMIVLPGCSSKASSTRPIIDSDDPWFSSETISCGDFNSGDHISPLYITPQYKVFIQTVDGENNQECNKLICFYEGETAEIDLTQHYPDEFGLFVECVFMKDDSLYACLKHEREFGGGNEIVLLDFNDNRIIKTCDICVYDNHLENIYIDKVCYIDGSYYVSFSFLVGSIYSYGLSILTNDLMPSIELVFENEISKWTVDENGDIFAIIEDPAGTKAIRIDSGTGAITDTDFSQDKVERYKYGFTSQDSCLYAQNKDLTITQLNCTTGEETIVFDYNECDANISQIMDYTPFFVNADTIIYVKSTFYSGEEDIGNDLLVLNKALYNPHAGKTVIYAAPSMNITPMQGEGIRRFNNDNSDYFIKVTMKYSFLSFDTPEGIDGISQYREFEYNSDITRISRLKLDIKEGIGPDILLDFGQYPVLNKVDYLIDLSGITDDLDDNDYFMNIFEGFKTNNNLYQIPLSASVSGIYSSEQIVGEDRCGFTFEQYDELLSNTFSGKDPIGEGIGRERYFRILMQNAYNDIHNEEGFLSIDNGVFRNYCAYSASSPESRGSIINEFRLLELSSFPYDLSSMIIRQSGYKLYGFPSLVDQGPMINCYESVALTKRCLEDTALFDAAKSFVNCMLSCDVQICNIAYNPVCIPAFDYYASCGLEYANKSIKENTGIDDYYNPSIIDEYKEYLSSAQVAGLSDSYTLLIINEEIQPFYQGQKSIGDVITIVESRVNNMIAEDN